MIHIDGVEFSYKKKGKNVLDGICMDCQRGTINVLLGLNGCGKTTLIKTMAGLLKPSKGSISYDGRGLSSIAIHERSRLISYVSQNWNAIGDFLVSDYLLFGTVNSLSFYESPKDEQKKWVSQVMDRFGINHLADKKMGELSGGERQIVSICSAVIQDTDVILLDEPTSALDIRNQHKVLSILKDIAEYDRKTIILSTHNPNHSLFLGGHTFLMKDGRILESGGTDLITVDRLRQVYGDNICNSRDLEYDEISFK